MIRILLFLLLGLSVQAFGQNTVQVHIAHKLGDQPFAFNVGALNNMNHDFNVSRLQYYISEFTIIHDGGMETIVEDLWELADVSKGAVTTVELGSFQISSVEALRFYIGVDPDHNHLDPASYPGFHPLSPQFPSMHWGWASGYRFLAMEGKGGPAFNQLVELHGLGDANYFKVEVPLTATASNNTINMYLEADYTRALENIAVNSGVVLHGDYGPAKQALENFRDYVFSPSAIATSVNKLEKQTAISVYPNPTNTNHTTVLLSTPADKWFSLSVSNALGQEVLYLDRVQSNQPQQILLPKSGIYILSFQEAGSVIHTEQLIIR